MCRFRSSCRWPTRHGTRHHSLPAQHTIHVPLATVSHRFAFASRPTHAHPPTHQTSGFAACIFVAFFFSADFFGDFYFWTAPRYSAPVPWRFPLAHWPSYTSAFLYVCLPWPPAQHRPKSTMDIRLPIPLSNYLYQRFLSGCCGAQSTIHQLPSPDVEKRRLLRHGIEGDTLRSPLSHSPS